MPKLQWEPKINAGHILTAASMFLLAVGLYYNTQAKIAAEGNVMYLAGIWVEYGVTSPCGSYVQKP